MKRRMLGLALLTGCGLMMAGLSGCSSDGSAGRDGEVGTLALPLSTQGPSGTTYRLRDAVFDITTNGWSSVGGEGGASAQGIVVSSEDDPNAENIRVDLERGYRYVQLRPGWRLEKVEGNSATNVEATLLSEATQWVYVRERTTSYVEFNFGLGNRQIWFNGKVNISVNVFESPDGSGGAGGAPFEGTAGEQSQIVGGAAN